MSFERILVSVVISVLLIANVLLQRRNHQLVSRNQSLEGSNVPEVGSRIATLGGADLNGKMVSMDYSRRGDTSFVLFFSPICRYSKQNWPNWNRLLQAFPNTKVLFLDGTDLSSEKFFLEMGTPVPTSVIKLSEIYKSQLQLRVTPTTVVLGPQGTVEKAFAGVLGSSEMEHLESVLKAKKM